VTHTAPRVALSLRQAVRNKAFALAAELKLEVWQDAAIRNLAQDQRSPLHIVAAADTGLDDVAASTSRLSMPEQEKLATAVVAALAGDTAAELPADSPVAAIVADLQQAQRPLILCGTACGSQALIDAAAAIAETLAGAGSAAMLSYCLPECNSMGAAILARDGAANEDQILERARAGEIDLLLIVENDLSQRMSSGLRQQLREQVPTWLGIDCLETKTLDACDWVLPAAAFSECEGTLVSAEGRAQRFFPVHPAAGERQPSWTWLRQLAIAVGRDDLAAEHFDLLSQHCADCVSLLSGITAAAPDHNFRSHGLKVPRQPHRYSGRTAMGANVSVHEPKQTDDVDSALAYTMEGDAAASRPGALMSYVWAPGWNSNQSLHKFQAEVGGSLRGGSGGVRLLDGFECPVPQPVPSPGRVVSAAANDDGRSVRFELQPRYRVFGSEETSAKAVAVAALVQPPTIEFNSRDAAELQAQSGDLMQVGKSTRRALVNDAVADGVALYSVGPEDSGDDSQGGFGSIRRLESMTTSPGVIGSDAGADHD